MIIKDFKSLSDAERRKIYDFSMSFNQHNYFSDYEDMVKVYSGAAYNNGESQFSLWDGERMVASSGVVTKEAGKRGEVFANISIKENDADKADLLISKVIDYCTSTQYQSMKLGVRTNMSYIIPRLEGFGFKETYRLHIMRYENGGLLEADLSNMRFEDLQQRNKKEFQQVHNEAFLISPNGAVIEDDEIDDVIEEYKSNPQLAGLYYQDGKAAGAYLLKLDGKTGWIDGIAVDPKLHNRGIGKLLLKRSVQLLHSAGADTVKLSVMSSNANAHHLYLKNGFVEESIESIWFERKNNR